MLTWHRLVGLLVILAFLTASTYGQAHIAAKENELSPGRRRLKALKSFDSKLPDVRNTVASQSEDRKSNETDALGTDPKSAKAAVGQRGEEEEAEAEDNAATASEAGNTKPHVKAGEEESEKGDEETEEEGGTAKKPAEPSLDKTKEVKEDEKPSGSEQDGSARKDEERQKSSGLSSSTDESPAETDGASLEQGKDSASTDKGGEEEVKAGEEEAEEDAEEEMNRDDGVGEHAHAQGASTTKGENEVPAGEQDEVPEVPGAEARGEEGEKGEKEKARGEDGVPSGKGTMDAEGASPARDSSEASHGKDGAPAPKAGVEPPTELESQVAEGNSQEDTQLPEETESSSSEGNMSRTNTGEELGEADAQVGPGKAEKTSTKSAEEASAPEKAESVGLPPVVAGAVEDCDDLETCNGHGKCEKDGSCRCFPPYTGHSCLRDACLDIWDCNECVGSSLGCYFSEGECRGDGLMSREESTCRPAWLATVLTYLQFGVFFGVVLMVAGCLVWRSRSAGFDGRSGTGFVRIPTAGPEGGEDWNWDPEEDNVELLKPRGEGEKDDVGAPTAQSTKTGIYALFRSSPASAAPPRKSSSAVAGEIALRRVSEGHELPSADDLFAELGMEAQPHFTLKMAKFEEREADSGHSSRGTRSSRLSAAGCSPVKSSTGGGAPGPGWVDDDDLDM